MRLKLSLSPLSSFPAQSPVARATPRSQTRCGCPRNVPDTFFTPVRLRRRPFQAGHRSPTWQNRGAAENRTTEEISRLSSRKPTLAPVFSPVFWELSLTPFLRKSTLTPVLLVVQRGNDRQPYFFTDADYLCYRTTLREAALRDGCSVHTYLLMTNHVRLLPLHRTQSTSCGNGHRSTGLLLVEPPRSRLRRHRPVLTPHLAYKALSADPATRHHMYRAMVMETVDPQDVEAIRLHLQRQHAYGSDRFRQAIEAQLGRTVGPQKIGRPRKSAEMPLESRL